jgi:signal transduction histidine kinase/CheY-like chemotaxis protein
MKTRTLIWIISMASVLLFVSISFLFKSIISSKNELLLKEGRSNLEQETGKIYSLKTQSIEQFVFDNSYWDELVNAIRNQDSAWIQVNMVNATKNFEIDCFWIFDEKGRQSYFYDSRTQTSPGLFDVPGDTLLRQLHTTPFKTFHSRLNGKLIQLVSAPVQPSADEKRKAPQQGYLICGRYFDSSFTEKLNLLGEKTFFTFTNPAATQADTIEKQSNTLRHYHPLKGFGGNTVAYLAAEKKVSYLSAYSAFIKTYIWAYLILIALILLGYYQFLRIRILKPLSHLSVALQTKNITGLQYLKLRKDEMAGFAKLVEDSFQQNSMLQIEVGARKESEAALKKSATELELVTIQKIRAEQDQLAKAEFLSTMSHEIRTPVNGVIGIANLLKDDELTPQQQELVDTLIFSSNHLLSILTDILDLSKIEAGNINFDRVSFNLHDICNSVHHLYAPQAKEKQISLQIVPDVRVQDYLVGDSVRLCQVLNNLVSNAIKFTEAGGVTLQYRMIDNDLHTQTIAFTVKDSGIGIPANKLDTIFESFTQASRSTNTRYGGTGLGLTICKKIIELQGGKISVTSKPGQGSVFSFFLTLAKSTASPEQPVAPPKKLKPASLAGMKILVAEDNKINALVLGKFLEKWKVKMQLVLNGQEALHKLEQEHFDMVLMDLHMPVMDGMQATQRIRQNTATAFYNIPIIALTADATAETQKIILAGGFNQYLTKPFNPDTLFGILEKYHQPPVPQP